MRFILQEEVEEQLDASWAQKAEAALADVINCGEEARAIAARNGLDDDDAEKAATTAIHKAVNKRAAVWQLAAKALAKVSHNKCWYCETIQDRSDMRVDHFRPKNRIAECPDHPGYWWKAFDWRNFRFSCTFCNERRRDVDTGAVGGKADSFPIIAPPQYARRPEDPPDVSMLLDPVCLDDAALLTFMPNGTARPAAKEGTVEYERAIKSIEKYHLDLEATRRRRMRIRTAIQHLVDIVDKALVNNDRQIADPAVKQIMLAVRPAAEYSRAARMFLGAYRSRPWVETIFQHL